MIFPLRSEIERSMHQGHGETERAAGTRSASAAEYCEQLLFLGLFWALRRDLSQILRRGQVPRCTKTDPFAAADDSAQRVRRYPQKTCGIIVVIADIEAVTHLQPAQDGLRSN